MTTDGQLLKRLAASLPDIPRWLEPRSMLLSGTCEVTGLDEGEFPSFITFSPFLNVASVVGRPPVPMVKAAGERIAACDGDLLAYDDNVDHVAGALPGWELSPAVLHLLGDSTQLPALEPLGPGGMHARPFVPPHALPMPYDGPLEEILIRFVSGAELVKVEGASPTLLQELQRTALVGKLAAVFVDGKPVSFCDAATETETLWDIGIETLEPYRRRGYAALCVAYVIDQMGRRRKRPVWGAEVSNSPSMNLAAKLGFRPVDSVTVLYPPGTG
jgi:GNAT superfamily N-acetyltransferase